MASAATVGAGRILTSDALTSVLPADALAYGAAWPVGWGWSGYSQGDVTLPMNKTTQKIEVNDLFLAWLVVPTGVDLKIAATLAQLTIMNLYNSIGIGAYTAASGVSGSVSSDRLVISGGEFTVNDVMVGLEVPTSDSQVFRAIFHRANASGNPTPTFGKGKNGSVATEFSAVGDPDNPSNPAVTFILTKVMP